MRKVLFSAAAISFVASSAALAADMGVPMTKGPALPAPAAYDWTGVYVGGHIGGGWQSIRFSDSSSYGIIEAGAGTANCQVACDFVAPATGLSSGAPDLKPGGSSFLGGLQAGWNYQIGRLVLGSEYDFSWTRMKGSSSAAFASNANVISGNTETFSADTEWTATATTRLGVAKDTWLFYGKAGAAWAHSRDSLSHNGFCTAACSAGAYSWAFASTQSQTRLGWTVGTGIEWAFARNWTAKLEYDFLDFGSRSENFPGAFTFSAAGFIPVPANIATHVYQQISEVKFGVNYKFDPGFLFW